MEFQEYLNKIKDFHTSILEFIDDIGDATESFTDLEHYLKFLKKPEKRKELIIFLKMLSKIGDNHHRTANFFNRFETIFEFFKEEIKQTLSNSEILDIFGNNKRILLILIEKGIFSIEPSIISPHKEDMIFIDYFSPEIQKLEDVNHLIQDRIKANLAKYDLKTFNEKRHDGNNDSYISQLIREDRIEEFITHVNQTNLSLSKTQIEPSLFDTNSHFFQTEKKKIIYPTLIEYSAFYGSIQIFQYLLMNNVEIKESLIIHAIHGRNHEIIRLIEEKYPDIANEYRRCLIEAIKCNHNDIAEYFLDLYDSKHYLSAIYNVIYYNYSFMINHCNIKELFHLACEFGDAPLVKFLLTNKELDINSVMVFIQKRIIYWVSI